jgi:signal transduction histidine kinase/DNA-binding response OmpR family regulator
MDTHRQAPPAPWHAGARENRQRPIWIITFGVLVLLYAAFLGLLFLRLPSDGYGVHISSQGFTIDRTVTGGALQNNDTIIGAGLPGSAETWRFDESLMRVGVWYRRVFGAHPQAQTPLIYSLLRNGVERSIPISLTQSSLGQVISRAGILFFVGLAFVLNGLFIVLRRGDEWAGQLIALALLTEGLNLFNNTLNMAGVNISASFYWLFIPFDYISFWFTFSLLLHIFLIFPERPTWFKKKHAPLIILGLYAFNPLVSSVGGLVLSGGSLLALPPAIYKLAYPISGVQLLAALGLMLRTYRTTEQPLVRNQIRWILWGVTVGTAGWLILFALPVFMTGNPITNLSIALIPLVFVPISLTFAVTRERLLQIDTVINRSLVYGSLSLFLLTVYFVTAAFVSRGIQILTGKEDNTSVVFLSTLTLALVFALARNRFQHTIDRTFYPDKLNFRQLLQVGQDLSRTIAFKELVTLLTETIPQRLGVRSAGLLVPEQNEKYLMPYGTFAWNTPIAYDPELERQLQDTPALLVDYKRERPFLFLTIPESQLWLPLYSHEQLVGLYGLGSKTSGHPYTGEEIEILCTLRHQIAISLDNTRLYHQITLYNKSLEDLVEQRTGELRQAHETVAGERNKLDAVLNTIADGLVVTDTQGRIILTNPVFENIAQQSAAHLIGRPLAKAIHSENLYTIVTKALADSTQVFSGDLHLNHQVYRASACALWSTPNTKTGTGASTPGSDLNNEISGVVTVLRDVTHEVAVDRMKTEFISTVSHELRTPLTSVLGFAKLINRTFERDIVPVLPPAGRKLERAVRRINENLGIIESESMRLTRLINDVLDIAKMEAGKIEWREDKVDLERVIRSAVVGTSALATEKGLPVIIEWPSHPRDGEAQISLPILRGDHDRLVQVITNLLSNAIKFTDQGQIKLTTQLWQAGQPYPDPFKQHLERIQVDPQTLSAEETNLPYDTASLPSPPAILISVTDTGIGIAPENFSTVFEKFKQVGDTLVDRPKGTGLGLSICKEIVEHHGGVIWAESALGIGSVFSVALPLSGEARPTPAEGSLIEIRRRVSERVPAQGDKVPLILVVDDEANIRTLLRQELSDAGYRVIEAANGSQALAETRRHHPDLIILDVMMPDLSGFDVTSALKADQQTADIPILILSIIEDRQHGLRLGADEYLTKPLDTEQLLHTIANLLSKFHPSLDKAKPSASKKKVLVVDDDVSVVEAITCALRERGFKVVEAYDPRSAIQCAQVEKPDLVILDAMLSKMNNYELLKALRYQDQEQRVSIIVLSSELLPYKDQMHDRDERSQTMDDTNETPS